MLFSQNSDCRIKKTTPNLGEFLVFLTISDLRWSVIAIEFLKEMFDRNVRWLIDPKHGGHPELAKTGDRNDTQHRLRASFDGSKTSLRLLMFQVYFLEKIGRPPNILPPSIVKEYDSRFGRPTSQMCVALQQHCKRILSTNNWPEFFKLVSIQQPSPQLLDGLLRDAIQNSRQKGYHR